MTIFWRLKFRAIVSLDPLALNILMICLANVRSDFSKPSLHHDVQVARRTISSCRSVQLGLPLRLWSVLFQSNPRLYSIWLQQSDIGFWRPLRTTPADLQCCRTLPGYLGRGCHSATTKSRMSPSRPLSQALLEPTPIRRCIDSCGTTTVSCP